MAIAILTLPAVCVGVCRWRYVSGQMPDLGAVVEKMPAEEVTKLLADSVELGDGSTA